MMPTGKAEPRFDIDFAYGREAELRVHKLLTWFASGDVKAEVKKKRYLDLYFYIETHCDKGRRGTYQPSGILVTQAKVYAFCLDETGVTIIFPTDLIRSMLNDPSTRDMAENDGSCPTRGKLIDFVVLLAREKRRRTFGGAPSVAAQSQPNESATERTCDLCGGAIYSGEEWFVTGSSGVQCGDCHYKSCSRELADDALKVERI